jgi:hypothetical protein
MSHGEPVTTAAERLLLTAALCGTESLVREALVGGAGTECRYFEHPHPTPLLVSAGALSVVLRV